MTKQELLVALKELDIQANTISFYTDTEGSELESSFGTCDLSGERGDIVPCIALNSEGKVISFEAGTWLVHGHLGKLAGAF
jgi:hypothetical protein